MAYSKEIRAQFEKYRDSGKCCSEIAELLNVSPSTCSSWEKQRRAAAASEKVPAYTSNLVTNNEPALPTEKAVNVLPKNYVAPNTRLSYKLFADSVGMVTGEEMDFAPFGYQKDTTITCTFRPTNTGQVSLTWYDKAAYNAICSIYQEKKNLHLDNMGHISMSFCNIYAVMVGHSGFPNQKQIDAVEKSVDKMRFINARIDYSAQCRKHNTLEPIVAEIDGYLLNATKISLTCGCTKSSGICLKEAPALYTYAQATNGQVLTKSLELLDIRSVVKDTSGNTALGDRQQNTQTNIALRHYLLWRVCCEQHASRNGRIVFENLIKNLGLHAQSRSEKQRIRNYCQQVMNYWVFCRFVASYTLKQEGHSYQALEFQLV